LVDAAVVSTKVEFKGGLDDQEFTGVIGRRREMALTEKEESSMMIGSTSKVASQDRHDRFMGMVAYPTFVVRSQLFVFK
jgi:hypothetical protein